MTRYLKTAFAAAAALLAASCISNDIPYPVVELRIANVEGEGFSVSENNVTSRVVTLTLDEATDIRNVKIDAVTYDAVVHSIELNKAELLDQVRSSQELTGTFNLLSPIYTTLSLYQDYDWTIRAVQTIERRFSVTGQIGATEIDTETASSGSMSPTTPIWGISKSRSSNSARRRSPPIRPRSKSFRAAVSNRCASWTLPATASPSGGCFTWRRPT